MLDFKLTSQRRWQRCLVQEAERLSLVCQSILQTRTKGLRASEGLRGKTNGPPVGSLRMTVGGNLFALSSTSLICPVPTWRIVLPMLRMSSHIPFLTCRPVFTVKALKNGTLPVPCESLHAVNLTFEIRHHRVELNNWTFHSINYSFPCIGLVVWFPNI